MKLIVNSKKIKHMKKITLLLSLFVCYSINYAQDDSQAKQILDDLSKATKAYEPIKAEFDFILENTQENLKDTKSGTIYFKGKKYRLELPEMVLYFNGETLWSYLPGAAEVNISTPDPEDDSFLNDPSRIFQDFDKDFKYKLVKEFTERGINMKEIDLVPKDLNMDFFRIKLLINSDKKQLKSAKYFSKDGNTYTITLKKFEVRQNVTDSDFTFQTKAHPDVEVIDLR